MRFHSAMASLETQMYVIAGTVRTENILLVSGRLVCNPHELNKIVASSTKFYGVNLHHLA